MDIQSKIIVCTTLDENGNVVRKDRFENSFKNLEEYLSVFRKGDSFIMESTGFYEPLYDFIESHGFKVILANPLKIKLIAESRMKNDNVDSEVLAKLLKNGWVPESYVPRKEIREIRRIVRTRMQIKQSTTTYKNRIRFELMRMHVSIEDPFTLNGHKKLRELKSPRVDSYLRILENMELEIKSIDHELEKYSNLEEVKLLMSIPGVGLFSALLIHSEIGDISRFGDSGKLLAYAGLIPSIRQSADIIHHGRITRQGSKYLRWIVSEDLHMHMRYDPGSSISKFYRRMSSRKGKSKALVASANKLLKVVYWILREKRSYISNQAQ